MQKRVAIVQSNYIPWKGYFDLINRVDEFILFDDRQYTRRDWRNRNRIKGPDGLLWLTIPMSVKGKYSQKISEAEISDPAWNIRHWQTIRHCYAKARYFREIGEMIEEMYVGAVEPSLSRINHRFLMGICKILGINTKITWSSEYPAMVGKTERLVHLCRCAGASGYLSGPSARDYMEEQLFEEAGITLEYMNYDGYPEYQQVYPPFEHRVSILDLLFNTGPNAPHHMLSFNRWTCRS